MPVLRQQRLLEPGRDAEQGGLRACSQRGEPEELAQSWALWDQLEQWGHCPTPATQRTGQRSAQGLRKSTLRRDGDFWLCFGGFPSELQSTASQAATHCSSGLFFLII